VRTLLDFHWHRSGAIIGFCLIFAGTGVEQLWGRDFAVRLKQLTKFFNPLTETGFNFLVT
jgi:hypothetical protein